MTTKEAEAISPAGFYDVRSQLQRFVYSRSEEAFAAGDAARDAITSGEELQARQKHMRRELIACLGGLPSSDSSLNAHTVGTVECDGFTVEKVIFESRPGAFVTADLYLPSGIDGPRGAVQFLCGHAREAKQHVGYQIVCQTLVRAGLVVLAQDPVGQGERLGYYEPALNAATVDWGITEHDHAGSQCLPLGDGLGRYFLHDAMRGIDYLCSRPEVDAARIGVTGNSGGGTQAALMMVCDPRLAAAAPGTFIMDRRSYMYSGGAQDSEQIWPGMTALGFDHEDVLLAMAPKPVLVLAVQYDYFPIEGTRRTVERAKRIWGLLGKDDHLSLVEDTCQHAYTRKLARAAAAFFSQHLLGQTVDLDNTKLEPLPDETLRCTVSGQVRGEIAGARFVYEENRDRLAELQREREAAPEAQRAKTALAWLRDQVFRDRRLSELNPREYESGHVDEMLGQWYVWWSQEGLFNHAVILRHYRYADKPLPLTIAVWPGGTTRMQPHRAWIAKTCKAGRAVMVLDPSGVGAIAPYASGDQLARFGLIHKLNDDLLWLNDSLAALRTYDVTRAVDVLRLIPRLRADDVRVHGRGRYAVYGQLAAALDDRIRGIEVVDGMGSYAGWAGTRHFDSYDIRSVVLPGVLRHFDLPDLEAWSDRS